MSKAINKEIFNKNSEKIDFSIDRKFLGFTTIALIGGLALYGGYEIMANNKEAVIAENPNTPNIETPVIVGSGETTEEVTMTAEKAFEIAKEKLPTVESIEISAESAKTPQELAVVALKITNDWYNAGATPENAKLWNQAIATPNKGGKSESDKFVDKILTAYDDIYVKALFPDSWSDEDTLTLSQYVEKVKILHRNTLELYLITSSPEEYPEDLEPFKRWDEITANAKGNVWETKNMTFFTTNTITHESNNADKNRVNSILKREQDAGNTAGPSDWNYITTYAIGSDSHNFKITNIKSYKK